MKTSSITYRFMVLIGLFSSVSFSQQMASTIFEDEPYEEAYHLANDGKYQSAKKILVETVNQPSEDNNARFLLARTYSWSGQYAKARTEFNTITSQTKEDRVIWIAAVKNELYAKEYAVALGLSNKALSYIKGDKELKRLNELALQGISDMEYSDKGWYNQETTLKQLKETKKTSGEKSKEEKEVSSTEAKTTEEPSVPKNRIGVNNAFTVFNERYDPVIFSSVTFRHQTKIGTVLPRINYSNRNGQHGLQYDIDFYPKFLKRFYAYVNYGYSNASIYPNHKFGTDIYMNLPNAMEISAGGRYISNATREIRALTNSIGYYKGNYYFTLRSFISPRENNLISVSGNLLVRKYLKDAENFFGVSMGMGFTPEFRQFFAGEELLAETVLFVESQRLNMQYQFTPKKSPNIYRANIGIRRQELAFDSGSFFWAISAGMTYEVKF